MGLLIALGNLGFGPSPQQIVAATIRLGPFEFNSGLFGSTLEHSDGGVHAEENWLNVVDENPGSPAVLTARNFDTGIANLGLHSQPPPTYTIGYATPIFNFSGDDLGVVVARFSTDTVRIAFSTDGGLSFTPDVDLDPETAVDSGAVRRYFYAPSSQFLASLFVHSLDLSDFGIAGGGAVNAVRVTDANDLGGAFELDLIRVAGFVVIPEPSSLVLAVAALMGLAVGGWRARLR